MTVTSSSCVAGNPPHRATVLNSAMVRAAKDRVKAVSCFTLVTSPCPLHLVFKTSHRTLLPWRDLLSIVFLNIFNLRRVRCMWPPLPVRKTMFELALDVSRPQRASIGVIFWDVLQNGQGRADLIFSGGNLTKA